MDIIKKCNLIKKGGLVSISKNNGTVVIENKSEQEATIVVAKVFKTQNQFMKIDFKGEVLSGNGNIVAKLVARDKSILSEIPLNTSVYGPKKSRFFMVALRITPT